MNVCLIALIGAVVLSVASSNPAIEKVLTTSECPIPTDCTCNSAKTGKFCGKRNNTGMDTDLETGNEIYFLVGTKCFPDVLYSCNGIRGNKAEFSVDCLFCSPEKLGSDYCRGGAFDIKQNVIKDIKKD